MIHEVLQSLPAQPGVYLFKDSKGKVLYVGKASSLRQRVRSYFNLQPVQIGNGPPEYQAASDASPKTERLVSQIEDIDFLVTDSEQEALILENNLIKKHRPRYNVRLRDDKTYPYLKIDFNEPWARIYFTRRWQQDNARYFGPFASAWSVRKTLDVIKRLFPYRTCTRKITGADPRACLEYDIHRCLGPCVGAVTKEEYDRTLRQVILFLEGRNEKIVRDLRRQMEQAAEKLLFEKAAILRDQVQAVEAVTERQKISVPDLGDADVIAFALSQDLAYVQVFFVRQGKLLGRDPFILDGVQDETPDRIMAGFLQLFYAAASHIPPLLLLQHSPADSDLIEGWLREQRDGAVKLVTPQRGPKRELLEMVAANARVGLEQYRIKKLAVPGARGAALESLAEALKLTGPPRRMECYDISNIQGTSAVGSMVVFEDGKPRTSDYRRFRIKTVEGANDYAMLQEVLRRRLRRASAAEGPTDGQEKSEAWASLPDLLLVDGGKGQLNAGLEVVNGLGLDIPLASLAKEHEEIYVPFQPEPIVLPRNSPALFLLQQLRDEAHRFAITYHRKVRSRSEVRSALDSVPGIGPRRKRALLQRFGSVRGIREAPVEEVAAVLKEKGLAEMVKSYI
ncbi:MAG: excinuclease ABC subunit UvrC [Chloroflexi bacterium]|nr:excinuclease ABC subunit UvrC [Chloroflexota bacterium]